MHKATKVLEALLDGREVTFDGYWPLVLNVDKTLCHRLPLDEVVTKKAGNDMIWESVLDTDANFDVEIMGDIGWFVRFCETFTDDEIEKATNDI